MRRQLLPILAIAGALIAISAFKWADPYWAFCGPCWTKQIEIARARWGNAFIDCKPTDNGHLAICSHWTNKLVEHTP